jgi:SAM-dependent methyltransferase
MSDVRIQHQITSYWNARGESYDDAVDHSLRDEAERALWLELLASQLPPPPLNVLDVGTGTGFLAILLSDLGHTVVGVDLSLGMLTFAETKGANLAQPPTFLIGDAHDPPGEPGSFDVVISRHLLWTLSDPLRALQSWRRLLRPGGLLVIIDGLWWAGTSDPDATDTGKPWHELWKTLYSTDVQAALPLMHAQSIEPAAELLQTAAFEEVSVERLTDLEQFKRQQGHANSELQPRFLLRGRRPL